MGSCESYSVSASGWPSRPGWVETMVSWRWNWLDHIAMMGLAVIISSLEEGQDLGSESAQFQTHFRILLWCVTLSSCRLLVSNYRKMRDDLIRQESIAAFQRHLANQRLFSQIPPAA